MKKLAIFFPILLLFAGCFEESETNEVRTPDKKARSYESLTIALPGGENLTLVKIKAGEFIMGDPDPGSMSSHGQTPVRITKDFWLGQTEVTQGQWQAVMGNNPSYFRDSGPNAPVEQTTWDEAYEFCQRVDQIARAAGLIPEGYRITLPSEAQWEYSARAGTKTKWWFGNNESDVGKYAWFRNNASVKTQPVGTKPHNPWGLYDMEGNVSEFTLSRSGPHPEGPVVDYVGPDTGDWRVVKGGNWARADSWTLPTHRRTVPMAGVTAIFAERDAQNGFRVALSSLAP